jgi:HK97 family phage major capsid protein
MTDEVKAGARHSRRDKKLLQDVKSSAARIVEAAVELGADEDDVREAVEEGAAGKALDVADDDATKREYSMMQREQMAKDGAAMPDGSFPIMDEADLRNAIQAYGRASDPAKAKAHIIQRARALGLMDLIPDDWKKSVDTETLVAFGNPVKALGEGKVGGYLVRFSTEADTDLTGEWFTAKTYFGARDGDGADTLFHHGMPVKSGLEGLADRLLKPLKTRKDEVGVWAETVLDMADEYERTIYQLVEAGKLGWSSGAPGHMVRKLETGEITRWPIAEGSLTPTPAEPRNRVLSLKALDTDAAPLGVEISKGRQGAANNQEVTMDEVKGAAPAVTEQAGSGVDVQAIVSEAVKAALADFQAKLEAEPALKSAGYAVPNVVTRRDGELTDEAAFKAWLKYGNEAHPAVLARMRAKRAPIVGVDASGTKATLAEGTDAQGGYWVPNEYANEIVTPLVNTSYLRRAGARVMRMQGTDSFRVPGITYTSAATIGGEGSAYTQAEPTASEVEFNPYKLKRLAKAAEEMVADSRYDVWSMILAPDFEQSFAEGENSYFTTGTGTGQPQGVVTGASAGVTAASQTAIAADEIIDLYHALDFKYRDRAVWMMADSTLKAVRKLKDGEGNYLWGPGLNGEVEGRLMGKPVITNNSMAAIATTAKTVLFGDFSYYWIAEWEGLQLQRLNELYAETGHIGFRAFRRVDANVMLSAAIKYLAQA